MGTDYSTEPWLTKRELASTLRCSVRTIERLHLPAMRVGGQNRYRLSEVEAYLTHKSRPARVIRFPTKERNPAA
ncbi:MAG: helix-turn-helix domain-containing protein [Solirubrobacterales bacterium]